MIYNNVQIEEILKGSSVLGTGGGGRIDESLRLMCDITDAEIIPIAELDSEAIAVTAYGAGGLTKPSVTVVTMMRAREVLQAHVGRIDAIVPVEIGPYSLAVAFIVARALGVPVIDADVVGYRSVPEIYIELATLANIDRCPLVVANETGDLFTLESVNSIESLEEIVRRFADFSSSNTLVMGYPMSRDELNRGTAAGSVSFCGEDIRDNENVVAIAAGTITDDTKRERDGFTVGTLTIETEQGMLYVDYKNEFIVLRSAKEVLLTVPDLILLVDRHSRWGINNGDDNIGKHVDVLGMAAIPEWRTREGIDLFHPRRLGFDVDVKLLGEKER